MMKFEPFTCSECGSQVVPKTGTGRMREYSPGFPVPIPDNFPLPTCEGCGEVYFSPEVTDKLFPILKKETLKAQAQHYRHLVDILISRHGTTQKEIGRAHV